MTNLTPDTPGTFIDSTPTIKVNANPLKDQAAALLRQVLVGGGSVLGVLHLAKAAGWLNSLAGVSESIVGIVAGAAGLGALVVGQLKTRRLSQKAAAMADRLPNSVAITK